MSKISVPLKKLSKSSFDLAEKSYDPKLSGEWIGTRKNNHMFLNTYIQEKFKDILHILPFVNFVIVYDQYSKTTYFRLLDYTKMAEYYIGELSIKPYIQKFANTSKRFTFFSLSEEQIDPRTGEVEGHAVSALYDNLTHKVEIFDSIGSNFGPFKKVFKELFVEIYGRNVKIVYMVDRCVAFGKLASKCDDSLYRYTSEGFCVVWVLWFLELRLSNPDIPKEKLAEKALKRLKDGDKVCKLLRGYAQFVDNIVSKYSLVQTRSNLVIKPKREVLAKKGYSYLFILLSSLVGSMGAFGLLNKFRKKRLSLDIQTKKT